MENHRASDRKPVTIPGSYRTGSGQVRNVALTDISETGCRFHERIGYLPKRSIISLKISTLGPFDCTVVWQSGGNTGIKFHTPLYGPILDHIVAALDRGGGAITIPATH